MLNRMWVCLFPLFLMPGLLACRPQIVGDITAAATVTDATVLQITPTAKDLLVNGSVSFAASGGIAPYTYSVFSGQGTMNPGTGVYTAPASAGSAVIRVVDSLGTLSDASISIYSPLSVTPAGASLSALEGGSISFAASGGKPPYTYSLNTNLSGANLDPGTGAYTAGSTSAVADIVEIRDGLSTVTATIHVYPPLLLSVNPAAVPPGGSALFGATGGKGTYTYSILTNNSGGQINASDGTYQAGAAGNINDTIQVSDGTFSATRQILVYPSLALSVSQPIVVVGQGATFTATGGTGTYTFSFQSNLSGGTVDPATGAYLAGGVSGVTDTIVVSDGVSTATRTVGVVATLSISPTAWTLAVGNSKIFTTAGGIGTSTFSLQTNNSGGNIDPVTGVYTAGPTAGVDTVIVTDGAAAVASATVIVNSALQISPSTQTLYTGQSFSFGASGGVTPYTYSITAGSGTIDANTGAFTAAGVAGSVTIRVSDALNNTSTASVTVSLPGNTYAIFDFNNQDFSKSGGWSNYVPSVVTEVSPQYQFNTSVSKDGLGSLDFMDTATNIRSTVYFGTTEGWATPTVWTFEFWQYLNVPSTSYGYMQKFYAGPVWGQYSYAYDGAQSYNRDIPYTDTGAQATNNYYYTADRYQWVHVALVRNGLTFTLYRNGTQEWTYTFPGGTNPRPGPDAFALGSRGYSGDSAPTVMMIDLVRISSVVRYTTNFTPPTSYTPD